MRILMVMIALLVGAISGQAAILTGQAIQPSDTLNDSYTSNGVISWFVEQWKEAGFDVPEEGKPFRWSDYLSPVPDKKGQAGDLIRYMDDEGKPHMALVLEPAGVNGPADTKVAVKYPIGPGMSMMLGVEEKDVVGYLRPHKSKAEPSPSPTKYKDGEV
jgi:hypothetical protein